LQVGKLKLYGWQRHIDVAVNANVAQAINVAVNVNVAQAIV